MNKKRSLIAVLSAITVLTGTLGILSACDGETDLPNIDLGKAQVTEISVSGNYRVEYHSGDTFNAEGMTVTATYDDGTVEAITDYEVTKTPLLTVDDRVTVGYHGVYASISIVVLDDNVNFIGLEITRSPYRTVYHAGDEFKSDGLIITAKYSDESTATITNYSLVSSTDLSSLKESDKKITFGYNGATVDLNMDVKPVSAVDKLEIAKQPTKTVVNAGEKFDTTGMEVVAVFEDATKRVLDADEYVVPAVVPKGVNSINVEYGGKSAPISVFVVEKNGVATDSDAVTRITRTETDGVRDDGTTVYSVNLTYGTLRNQTGSSCWGPYVAGDFDPNPNPADAESFARFAETEYLPIDKVASISALGTDASGKGTYVFALILYDKDYNFICADAANGKDTFTISEATQEWMYQHAKDTQSGVDEADMKVPYYFRFAIRRNSSGKKDNSSYLIIPHNIIKRAQLKIVAAEGSKCEFRIGWSDDLKYTYNGESLGTAGNNTLSFVTVNASSGVNGFIQPTRAARPGYAYTTSDITGGAAYGDYLFTSGEWTKGFDVWSIKDNYKIAGTIVCNDIFSQGTSLSFGKKYDENDEFPLLYSTVGKAYINQDNAEEFIGACAVYRITKTTDDSGKVTFSCKTVQIIKIGFTDFKTNPYLWLSDESDENPYGNFTVDAENGKLYAYVQRESDNCTRFFEFALPEVNAGEQYGETEIKKVVLNLSDVTRTFDVSLMHDMHDAAIKDGKIYTLEGARANLTSMPRMRVIDIEKGQEVTIIKFSGMDMFNEQRSLYFLDDTLYTIDISGRDGGIKQESDGYGFSQIGHFIFY